MNYYLTPFIPHSKERGRRGFEGVEPLQASLREGMYKTIHFVLKYIQG